MKASLALIGLHRVRLANRTANRLQLVKVGVIAVLKSSGESGAV